LNFLKRIVALALVFAMLFLFAACNRDDKNPDDSSNKNGVTEAERLVELPYSREDGLNPFFAESLLNNGIMPLLYSGLFYLDANYEAQKSIASGIEINGKETVVTIDASKKFSNGSGILASDIVYSFELAKASLYYGSMLETIESCAAVNSSTVSFVTLMKDVYIAGVLTFPIVKRGTAIDKKSIPVGAGKYKYEIITEGGKLVSSEGAADVILKNVTNTDSLLHSLVVGNYDAVLDDLSGGKSQRINASAVQVDLNNLIFLGVNHVGAFNDSELVKNLNIALDKESLINIGFEGYGIVADTPFNPNWYVLDEYKPKKVYADESKEYIKKKLSKRVVTVLVNSDNNFKVKFAEELCSQLGKLGVKTKLSSVPFSVYKSGIEGGYYDLYVGEYKLCGDMNISRLINTEVTKSAYYSFMSGSQNIGEFMAVFNDDMPFIPVAFRMGILAYSRELQAEVNPLPNNVFANLAEWSL